MDFEPIIRGEPKLMDARIFRDAPMGLRGDLLSLPLEQRFTLDEDKHVFFVNLERFSLRSADEIEKIRQIVEARLAPLGHKVKAIVNYDNFVILPELLDPYSDMVRGLTADFYSHVTRYTTSGFLRMKLGKALQKRGLAPHIYESAAEAADAEAVEHAAKYPEGV
jgi:propionate CoA-transferase